MNYICSMIKTKGCCFSGFAFKNQLNSIRLGYKRQYKRKWECAILKHNLHYPERKCNTDEYRFVK